jgi:hypothetical protein
MKDPCIDTNFVNILPPALPEIDYDIYSGTQVNPAHPAFVVDTVPVIGHSLCGALTQTPLYGTTDSPLDAVNGPLTTYDPATNVFTAESVDPALIDTTKPYKVHTEFTTYPSATYPTVTEADATGIINFGNECLTPVFTATSQTGLGSNSYDGQTLTFTLNPFSITPAVCGITYSCVSIEALEASPEVPTCGDFTGDLNAAGTLSTSFDIANDYPVIRPQSYSVKIAGTATKSGEVLEAFFTFELTDVCDPPTSVTRANLIDQTFNIEDDSLPTYEAEAFSVSPDVCLLTYT